MTRLTRTFSTTLAFLLFLATTPALAQQPDDRDALQGIQTGKALFDINLKDAEPLVLYLQVIKRTHAELLAQGVTPDFIIAFRGPSVTLISTDVRHIPAGKAPTYAAAAELIADLKALGARFEACSIATEVFGVDNTTIFPEIKVVGNTFISAIGYQSRRNGYALIPIM